MPELPLSINLFPCECSLPSGRETECDQDIELSDESTGDAYRQSGVDLGRMDELKERIRGLAASTHGPGVIDGGGSFAGLFQLGGDSGPVLVASTDGVGTKLKIAAQLGHFESIGRDPGHPERQ